MAFVLPYIGYYIYTFIVKRFAGTGQEKAGVHYIAAVIGSYIGINAAAFCASVEFGIQPLLFTDSLGNALYCPYDLSVSIPAMMIPHLAVAGVVEAAFTVAVFAFVRKTAPDLIFENIRAGKETNKKPIPVFALVAVLIAATPLGLIATAPAWGEWGSDEIAEVVTNGAALGYTPSGLANGWSLNSLMPDYGLEGMNEVAAYILSAIIGVALLIILFKLFSIFFKGKKVSYDA
jgi:cobalt/nickel transport system permease protein